MDWLSFGAGTFARPGKRAIESPLIDALGFVPQTIFKRCAAKLHLRSVLEGVQKHGHQHQEIRAMDDQLVHLSSMREIACAAVPESHFMRRSGKVFYERPL